MTRDDFIARIAVAILVGQRWSDDPADRARAIAYATQVADKLPGLFRAGVHKIRRWLS